MAKIYGTPIGGGGTGTNTTLPPLLDNFKAKAKGNISKKGHGEAVNIIDSIESKLNGLKLYGKSTQDGTPTPEAPVPIVSAGENNNINLQINGSQLFPLFPKSGSSEKKQYEYTIGDDGKVSITKKDFVSPKNDGVFVVGNKFIGNNSNFFLPSGTYRLSGMPSNLVCIGYKTGDVVSEVQFNTGKAVILDNNTNFVSLGIRWTKDNSFDSVEFYPMLNYGDKALPYESYKSQTLLITTPNGLSGIPVDSGGNYTDADGQQWICDEVDFGMGTHTQRIGKINSYNSETVGNIWMSTTGQLTPGATVLYKLDNPIVSNLDAEMIADYEALTTYAPVTNITTDSTPAAGIEIEYASTTMNVELSADKMEASRANELAGAVWVYGDHEPESVNDGTKIQLSREEAVDSGSTGTENQTVSKTIQWNNEANFFARQFTYNSKKQYQTMLEGAIATITLVGVPEPVSELAEQHSGSSITLTWKNPTSDELYDHTVVVYKTDAFPTSIDDGMQGYTGTNETATLSDLELGTTYYIAVFTVSYIGVYGQPETIQVEIPAGQLLSSLASGTKVKLGKWNNTDLQWKVARDTSDQSIRLVLEPTSVSLLGNMQYDAPEPSNSDSNRKRYGNNRYIYSNIHQWLNATKASNWYTAQHSADAAPSYSSSPGFLSGWSENHIAALDRATLTVSRSSTDGGGTETFVSRVALMSTTELGLESGTGNGRLDIFNSDGDRATGSAYWTRTPHSSNSIIVRRVHPTGTSGMDDYANRAGRFRPLCIPASTALVSLKMDDDGCYVVQ